MKECLVQPPLCSISLLTLRHLIREATTWNIFSLPSLVPFDITQNHDASE